MNTTTTTETMNARVTFSPSPLGRGILAVVGLAVPVVSYVALHVMHPEGRIENMTDPQLAEWAQSGAHMIWAGGALELAVALLMLVFAAGLDERWQHWGASPALRRVGAASFHLVAGLVAICALLQVMTGVIATPEEAQESETLLPVLALLYGNLNVAVWCLLLPATAVTAAARRAPTWLRLVSALVALVLAGTLALPFVSWFPAFVWLAALAVAVAVGR
jgi:hypothetical protein